jgi:HEPN/Toprim N-terminal domain 1
VRWTIVRRCVRHRVGAVSTDRHRFGAIRDSSPLGALASIAVSSYAYLYIDGTAVFAFRNEVDPTFMFLFKRADVRRSLKRGCDRPERGYEPDDEFEVVECVSSAGVIRDRLDVLGIGRAAAAQAFHTIIADQAGPLVTRGQCRSTTRALPHATEMAQPADED